MVVMMMLMMMMTMMVVVVVVVVMVVVLMMMSTQGSSQFNFTTQTGISHFNFHVFRFRKLLHILTVGGPAYGGWEVSDCGGFPLSQLARQLLISLCKFLLGWGLTGWLAYLKFGIFFTPTHF